MDNGASSYRRYLDGDEDAFGEIVKEYFDKLVFFVNRYVCDFPAAEDIAVDVFARLLIDKNKYNFRVSMKTYLFMLGRSRALDYLKHRGKLQTVELSEAGHLPSDAPLPEALLLADERRCAVNTAVSKLSKDLRLVIHLIYFEEMSCDEAARVLKKNKKQVYNLLYRAKKELRTILGKEGEFLL